MRSRQQAVQFVSLARAEAPALIRSLYSVAAPVARSRRELTLLAGRRVRSVTLCLAALVVVLVLPCSSACAAVAFEASGRCVTTSWNPTGQQVQSLEFLFEVRVAEAVWSIRVDDLSVRAGKRAGADFEELFCDGTDLFQVHHCPDAVRTNLAPRHQFNTYGSVGPATFPTFATPIVRILWLTFCSGKYPPLSAANLPLIDNSLMPTNVAAVTVDYYPTLPHVPKRLMVWAKGVLLWDSTFPRGIQLIRPTGPFEDGFLALEVESAGPTNALEGVVVPQHLVASFYGLDLAAKPARRYRGTEIVVSVKSLGPVRESLVPPELAGAANVLDTRFTNKLGRVFRYVETNGTWVSRSDPTAAKALDAKSPAPIYMSRGSRGIGAMRHVLRGIVLLTLCAPIALYLIAFLRRRNRNAENNQRIARSI